MNIDTNAIEAIVQQVMGNINLENKASAPVIDGEYEFHFPGETPALHIAGRRVVVWPFVPQTKFREQLQWLTDVMQAYSAEQRLAIDQA